MKFSLQNLISAESNKKNVICNKTKLRKKIISIVLAAVMLMNAAPVTAFADNRDAGIMNKENAKWVSSKYAVTYEAQNEGGFTVYVPYSMMMTETGTDKQRRGSGLNKNYEIEPFVSFL